jgi:hypothetical protein
MDIMHSLEVEWRHEEGQKSPCYRCSDTGMTFFELLDEVEPLLISDGIEVTRSERLVPWGEGNHIILNEKLLEGLLDDAGISQSYCQSTKWLHIEQSRQAVRDPDGTVWQQAPEILYRKAILRSLEPEYLRQE